MVELAIHLFGPFTATLDGQPVASFRYEKVRALLAYLAAESRSPLRREVLGGLLWPDVPQKVALDNLRNALFKLRQVIQERAVESPYILASHNELQLNIDHRLWIDAALFNQCISNSKNHPHRRIEGCKECIGWLTQAAQLYQGEFLQDLYLEDSDLFNDWVERNRETYHRTLLNTLSQLADNHTWLDEYELALSYALRQTKLDPYNEIAHRQVIHILATCGQSSDAQVHYEQYRQSLHDDLNTEPALETQQLYNQIKFGKFHRKTAAQKFPAANLPVEATSFVGRQQELASLHNLIANPSCRLLTLVGPGGVGKTRLALAAAPALFEDFHHGGCFISLAPIQTAEFIIPAIAQALDLPLSAQADPKIQLMDYLRDKELLLVLDNFEHLVENASLLTEILHHAPGVVLLITSRQRLGLRAEWLFEVEGLIYPMYKLSPGSVNPTQLESYDAVQLFLQRMQQVSPRVDSSPSDLPEVVRICQLVEGIPLGIELAAASVRVRSVRQIAEVIEHGQEDLVSPFKDMPERHRSLRTIFEHSWRLLKPDEQQIFAALAVFRGGFDFEASVEIALASPDTLTGLADKSLLRCDPGKNLMLHELIRQFAWQKLREQGRENLLRDRHLAYFLEMAEKADQLFEKEHQFAVFDAFERNLDNFRAALEWSLESGQLTLGLQLACALVSFWEIHGFDKEGFTWIEQLREHASELPRDLLQGRLLQRTGRLAVSIYPDFSPAIHFIEQSLAIFREIGYQPGIAVALADLGWLASNQSELSKGWDYLNESLHIYQSLGDTFHVGTSLVCIGDIHLHQGELIAARACYQTSLDIHRKDGDEAYMGAPLGNLGLIHFYQGDYATARVIFEKNLAEYRRLNWSAGLSGMLTSLGMVNIYEGDYASAGRCFDECLELYTARGPTPYYYSDILYRIALLARRQGDEVRAMEFFKQSLHAVEGVHDPLWVMDLLERFAGLLIACNQPERAAMLFSFASHRRIRLGMPVQPLFRAEIEGDIATLSTLLGEARFQEAWSAGQLMSLQDAIRFAQAS